MTIDEVIANTAAQIDQILAERWDQMALRMVADGMDPNEPYRAPSADDGPWSRVSFGWVLQQQKEIDREWRDRTLAELRQTLLGPWKPVP
jgi:hypothetical protein